MGISVTYLWKSGLLHALWAQVLAFTHLLDQHSLAISSVGLIPRTNGPSTLCGLHRDKQIRSHLGELESGGCTFSHSTLVTYLLKAPAW